MLIKSSNFSLDQQKMEGTYEERPDGLGWAPGYEMKSEGTRNRNSKRYTDNYGKVDWNK